MTLKLPPPLEKMVAPHGGPNQTWYMALKEAVDALNSVLATIGDVTGGDGDGDGDGGSTSLGTAAFENIGTSGSTVPKLNGINSWNRQQSYASTTIDYAASMDWNLNLKPAAVLTLTGNGTLNNPTQKKAITTYLLIVKQDATGGRTLSFGSDYKWVGGITPVMSTDPNAVDVLTFVCDGTDMLGAAAKAFA